MPCRGRRQHEFSHAFAYLIDEYIDVRGSTAGGANPAPEDQTLFNTRNLTYSNLRCDLLWPHLAPGGRYNPNPRSLIGNLFKGGKRENGVWHSEYTCLMNGRHANYFCDDTEPAGDEEKYLRDGGHFCFWCEEIVAMRIVEKTRQFGPESPSDALAREWFEDWDASVRHSYFTFTDVADRIAERDACYRHISSARTPCPPEHPDCDTACEHIFEDLDSERPTCIAGCNIRDVGNAVFVYSGAGTEQDGSRRFPYGDIETGVSESHEQCWSPYLVMIQPGAYPAPISLETPATLLAEGCSSTFVGE